jgi:hypothetical protein
VVCWKGISEELSRFGNLFRNEVGQLSFDDYKTKAKTVLDDKIVEVKMSHDNESISALYFCPDSTSW